MRIYPVCISALIISSLGCNDSGSGSDQKSDSDDSLNNSVISSSAAVENSSDTIHKFVRTADLKFKVGNVAQSTATVEDIAVRQGGFVAYTKLSSEGENVTTIPVSKDSSLEATFYNMVNSMVLRVPNTRLDTTLKEIAATIDYIDYRIIKADDVRLQLLSNELAKKRTGQTRERLKKAIDAKPHKLGETTAAEDVAYNRQEQADQSLVSNLSLADQIAYSTISLNFYQRQGVRREMISSGGSIDAYVPGFGAKILESLQYGWQMLETFLVFVTRLWALVPLGAGMYVLYRSWKHGFAKW